MRIIFFGDIVGKPGRKAFAQVLPRWRDVYNPDIVLANGENAAGGLGITGPVARELFEAGADVVTLGNHTFHKKEVLPMLEEEPRLLRPANYPPGVPGNGYGIFPTRIGNLAVLSLMGRVFMDPIDDPFRCAQTLVPLLRERSHCILIDVHAEATSEKMALAWMLDGQVAAVVGTHTHVPTADARILPGGTAFITDVGMVGPYNSVLGVDTETIIQHFLTWMPARFEVASGPVVVNAVLLDLNEADGRAEQIQLLQEVLNIPQTAQ